VFSVFPVFPVSIFFFTRYTEYFIKLGRKSSK
jgi:hypothetical protein